MTDEQKDEEREDDEQVESAELTDEDLEEASGGNYTGKNPNSPFQP